MAEEKLSKKKQKALDFRTGKLKVKKAEKQKRITEEKDKPAAPSTSAKQEEDKKEDKKPKDKKRKRDQDEAAETGEAVEQGEKAAAPAPKKAKGDKPTQHRFILFVGNLPYSATTEKVKAHFAGVGEPSSIRLPTAKEPPHKPKGFAFVEFTNPSVLKKALKLHHTFLDGRKINIELTAGGGGKSEARTKKLREKNDALTEERRERIKEENEVAGQRKAVVNDGSGINPERLRMMQQQGRR